MAATTTTTSTAADELRVENDRIRDEIHALVLRNTRLQREIMTLNTSRERAAVQGSQLAHELTTELTALDDELKHVRAQCHAMRRTLSSQRTGVDRIGEQISSESSMSSTRFRRMSSALLGNGNSHGNTHGAHPTAAASKLATPDEQSTTRSRGASVASAFKRRGSVMMRFKGSLAPKAATMPSTPAPSVGGDGYSSSSDDNHSVDIDALRGAPILSPMRSPTTIASPALSPASSSDKSSTASSTTGRPPLLRSATGSSSNVLAYRSSDEKKNVVEAHKEHLSNFRRSSRSSRRVVDTTSSVA